MVLGWILMGFGLLILFVFVGYFNRFVRLENRIDNSLSQIDVQLKRRADLIPNLVSTVKGYMKHEKSVMNSVTSARKALVSAGNIAEKVKAGDNLQTALGKLFAIAENYPNLKANENFAELQRELTATEDKVAYSRQRYNDDVLSYQDLHKTFPGNLFAKLFKKTQKEYLKIAEAERKSVKVEF
jgi:LemA protein